MDPSNHVLPTRAQVEIDFLGRSSTGAYVPNSSWWRSRFRLFMVFNFDTCTYHLLVFYCTEYYGVCCSGEHLTSLLLYYAFLSSFFRLSGANIAWVVWLNHLVRFLSISLIFSSPFLLWAANKEHTKTQTPSQQT